MGARFRALAARFLRRETAKWAIKADSSDTRQNPINIVSVRFKTALINPFHPVPGLKDFLRSIINNKQYIMKKWYLEIDPQDRLFKMGHSSLLGLGLIGH